jgi:preprotein translocase subunit SecA
MHRVHEAKEAELGPDTMREAERIVLLRVLDAAWRDHLYEMDYLQEGIGLRAMAQRDPLVEYQREGYELFQDLLGRIREDFSKYILHIQAAAQQRPPTRDRQQRQLSYHAAPKTSTVSSQTPAGVGAAAMATAQASGVAQSGQAPSPDGDGAPVYATVRRDSEKIGRNDPCPCGSGKKYKKCHGANL